MINLTPQQLEKLLPLASAWATEQEQVILLTGIGLDKLQMSDAKRIGVMRPDHVRLLRVPNIPTPRHPLLRQAAKDTTLITPFTIGLTLRYGIFIRDDNRDKRSLVVHELVHVKQYEQLGSIEAFLRKYLGECVNVGYSEAPMEQEAIRTTREIDGGFTG